MKENAPAVLSLEDRILLYSVTMNPTPDLPYHVDFQVGWGFPVQFARMTKGTVTSVSSGTFRYTPFMAALGDDNFTATYQPTYGGYSGYNPPPTTTQIPMTINFPSYGATMDESYANPDPATSADYPTINYFALKDNTLTITPDKGVLKNDTTAPFVSYLTAHQVGNGQYGTFNIQPNGGFTYTPFSSVFTASFNGLTDTCQYYPQAPDGSSVPVGLVKVDLAEVFISRSGADIDSNLTLREVYVGEQIALSVGRRGEFPTIPGISTFQWTVGTHALDGYTGYSQNDMDPDPDGEGVASRLQLSAAELMAQSLSLYWVKEGTRTVDLSVACPTLGQTQSDHASFEVSIPSATMSVSPADVEFDTDPSLGQVVDLAGVGITFSRTPDFSQTGSYRWTQLVIYDRVSHTNDGVNWIHSAREGGVDNSAKYPDYDELVAVDSPDLVYEVPGAVGVKREFKARMYLMWKHESANSIWVPLYAAAWKFEYEIAKTGDQWNFVGGPNSTVITSGPAREWSPPEWTRVYDNDDPYVLI